MLAPSAPAAKPAAGTTLPRLQREIPIALLPQFRPFLALARNLGIGVSGTRGVGKSQLLRIIAWLDFVAHLVPCIVIDPIGAIIDGILAQICQFHPDDQRALWPRVRHVNLSPEAFVVPTPLYARTALGRETLFDVAQRLPDTFLRLDPNLKNASVLGYNSLWELATYGGSILVALGYQASELPALLTQPEAWEPRLIEAERRFPELHDAVTFFRRDYMNLTPGARRERTNALRNKLTLLADPVTKAQFCAATPGIDFREVMDKKLLVLYDLRFEGDWQLRQFKLLWLLLSLIDFIKRWGALHSGQRSTPLSLIIDELSFLVAKGATGSNPLVDDLDGLINRLSRNYNVWCTLSFQEPYQLSTGIRQTLMSLGTHFLGRMTDPESMRGLADRFTTYDPYWLKKVDKVYASAHGEPFVVDQRTQEFSLNEQRELNRQRFATLPKYHFLVSRTVREGDPPIPLAPCSIAPFAAHHFPDPRLLHRIRRTLSQRDGRPVGEVLAEIAARQAISASASPEAHEAPPRRAHEPLIRAEVELEDE